MEITGKEALTILDDFLGRLWGESSCHPFNRGGISEMPYLLFSGACYPSDKQSIPWDELSANNSKFIDTTKFFLPGTLAKPDKMPKKDVFAFTEYFINVSAKKSHDPFVFKPILYSDDAHDFPANEEATNEDSLEDSAVPPSEGASLLHFSFCQSITL